MNYLKVTVSDLDAAQQEILIAQLSELNFIGFEQKEQHLLAYANEQEADLEGLALTLADNNAHSEIIPEVNWNEQWERDFEPIIIEDQVAIRAHFHKAISAVKHEIIITPKMSFGTGHHATTQLMLTQMSTLNFSDKKVFDYGTGTGVLSVYAEQLGAQKIIANDIDPWSEENAKENVDRNGCNNIEVRLGGIDVVTEDNFDCILANINLNVLKSSMELLVKKVKNGQNGLLLSGILEENEDDITSIINTYTTEYQLFKIGKWLCIHVKI